MGRAGATEARGQPHGGARQDHSPCTRPWAAWSSVRKSCMTGTSWICSLRPKVVVTMRW